MFFIKFIGYSTLFCSSKALISITLTLFVLKTMAGFNAIKKMEDSCIATIPLHSKKIFVLTKSGGIRFLLLVEQKSQNM